jgi:hypothetical protein|tara:strand:+ start:4097 stop:4621 length:525 start_codon:yes stop_codon:yes gene_type:complete
MSCVRLFINSNYDYLLGIANKYVGEEYGGDLLNDLFLIYLEGDEKHEEMCERGELMKYICRTLAICGFSKSSRFYYKYKKHRERHADRYPIEIVRSNLNSETETGEKNVENQMNMVFSILEEVRWFDANVFKSYYLHSHSLRTLSDATGIPKNTLYKSIQKAKAHLQENTKRIR